MRKKGLVLCTVMLASLCVSGTAYAWLKSQAETGIVLFAQKHCGSLFYKCNGFYLIRCLPTGVNVIGKPQWLCLAGTLEKRKRFVPDGPSRPPSRTCTVGAVFTPSGDVVNWNKRCEPFSGVSSDRYRQRR